MQGTRSGILGLVVMGLVVLAGLAPVAWAESHEEAAEAAAPPSLYFVWTDHVSVSNAAAYEAEVKKMIAAMGETEAGKEVSFFALSGQAGYAYVMPMTEFNDLSKMNQKMMAAITEAGGLEAWDTASQYVESGSGQFLALLSDHSYTPAEPREAEAQGAFRMHEWWYIQPGKEMAAMDVARRVKELWAAKGIDSGWRFYQAVTGEDLPLFLVTATGMNAADYYANDARVSEILGDEMKMLIQEAVGIARKVERTTSRMRPDLSMGN